MPSSTLLLGQTLSFHTDPFVCPPTDAARHDPSGAILIANGRIADLGPADRLRSTHPEATVKDYGRAIVMAGFIDAHVHYPQTAIIGSWGARLIDWLEQYTFPEESRFVDIEHARSVARQFVQTLLANGTTSFSTFCTSHPTSVEAIMMECRRHDLRAVAGLTCMDRNVPSTLQDTARSAYDDSKSLIQQWHGTERLTYAITPRFAPTSSPEQLEALGALWAEHPDCLMQTHLSEQSEEVDWVRSLYPSFTDYLHVYDHFGLLGPGGLYGHAIHLQDRERARLREAGGAIIHCPTSNMFIGSGLLPVRPSKQAGLVLGLASDIGGGSSFSMLRTMAAAYEISQLTRTPLHPAQLLWLATVGNATVLGLAASIGNLAVGLEADLIVIDPRSRPDIATAAHHANDIWSLLFPTIMMGDDRAILDVWIKGRQFTSEEDRPRGHTPPEHR